jgi:hypothetical protein
MGEGEPGLRGRVAKLVTDQELVINIGSEDGVKTGMIFEVLDQETEDIVDPVTFTTLGSIDRIKARVRVTKVGDHIALAEATSRRDPLLSSAAQVLTGQPSQSSTRLTGNIWPNGVRTKDPVRLFRPSTISEQLES